MSLFDRLRRALSGKPGSAEAVAKVEPEKADAKKTDAELEHALSLHEAGDLQGAERAYTAMLARNPRNADALHLMGLIAHQHGNHAEIGRAHV